MISLHRELALAIAREIKAALREDEKQELAPAAPAPPVAEAPKPEPAAPEPPKEKVEAPAPPPVALPAPPPAPVEAQPTPEPIPPASQYARVCSPVLVSDEEAAVRAGIGELLKTVDNRVMVTTEDRVVVGLDATQPLNPGDRVAAVRVGRRVIHPITGKSAGRILVIVGLLEVTDAKDRVARARIAYSCAPMGVGDRIVRFVPAAFPEDKTPQPTLRAVSAAVLDSLRGEALLGLQQYAFVDVGADQGVAHGGRVRHDAVLPAGGYQRGRTAARSVRPAGVRRRHPGRGAERDRVMLVDEARPLG